MTSPARRAASVPTVPPIASSVAVAVAAGLVAWLLLSGVRAAVVAVLYAVGVALVIGPLLLRPRGAGSRRRPTLVPAAVALGVALVVLGRLLTHHAWLLVAVPLAAVGVARVVAAARRPVRRRP